MTRDSDRPDLKTGVATPQISDSLRKPNPKRFYKDATVSDAAPFAVLLDGRAVKTPKKRPLALPTRQLANAIAEEWQRQESEIDPTRMPLTRLANSAIDAVQDTQDAVAADIVAYAGTDLICYRAETPDDLVRRQAAAWNPLVAWARDELVAALRVTTGVVHVRQPDAALEAIARALKPHDAFRLTALHVLTTITGSAIIALAVAHKRVNGDQAWTAAHIDEDYQISLWGEDHEAAVRRRLRRAEFNAATQMLELIESQ